MDVRRRALPLLLALAALAARASAAQPGAEPGLVASALRVGTLRFGALGWELDVMRAHGLDKEAGITVAQVEFAAAQAAQVALQAGGVDVVMQDWLFVSRQRASGADWTFVPGSSALGAVMAPPDSAVRTVADLPGHRLGVAGSPLDKSWLILRAYGQKTMGLDLDDRTDKTFGPPPLLAEQLAAGRLDAVLTFWPFAARAEAQGQRLVLDMAAALEGLGIPPGVPLLGYVFSDAWAGRNGPAIRGYLEAAGKARAILAASDAEWERIMPLTGAANQGELARLRDWYRRGIPRPGDEVGPEAAARLYDILAAIGGPALVGPALHLAPGTFWQAA